MKTGVLIVNLGTPASCAPKDVRRYLLEFLTDGRVVDLPWLKRNLIVRGLIVPKRYKESAATYAKIWTEQGSPLMVHSLELKEKLAASLGQGYHVELAMRYQEPSIKQAMQKLSTLGLSKLIVLPLFPQYASATTGSIHQRVMEELSSWLVVPKTHFVSEFADHPAFIDALREIGCSMQPHSYDHILMSFHGLPEGQVRKADPVGKCLKEANCCSPANTGNCYCYKANCMRTARALSEALSIPKEKLSISFQSRLGSIPWLQPYTVDTIQKLGQAGAKRVLVFCPSFVCDCIETTYEIGMEAEELFHQVGGESLTLVPGLNTHPVWIHALKEIIGDYCAESPALPLHKQESQLLESPLLC